MPRLPLPLLLAVTLAACGLETRPNPNYHPTKDAGTSQGGNGDEAGGGGKDAGRAGGSGRGGTSGIDAGHARNDGGAAVSGGVAGRHAMTDGGGTTGAGTGGDSGQAGMNAGACGGPCIDPTPVCERATGLCVECELDDDCKDISRPACDTPTHSCVQCTKQQDCGGTTTVCDATAHACVQCLQRSDCAGSTPQCDISAQTCVECLQSSDCGDPLKARCDAEACKACTSDADCTRLTATPVCDEGRGACVECTADTEASQCGAKACKRATGTCTLVDRGARTACGECEADSECVTGAKCVLAPFGATTLGPYCFFDRTTNSGCADTVVAVRPYSQSLALTSIDGAMASYCLPPSTTTCPGIKDAILQSPCATDATVCGEPGLEDAVCPGSGSAAGHCTYGCQHDYDCPQSGFTTCNAVGTPRCE
jgi:hypothetical protein